MFTDSYGEQSCTAGRASFITGQSGYRTGLTKVGLPGADVGLQAKDATIAELLKPLKLCHRSATGSSWLNEQSAIWYRRLKFLIRQTHIVSLLLRHPAVPWHAKLVAACMLGYLFSPIQLIPNFIPVIGQSDDLVVLIAGMKLLRILTPRPVVAECEYEAEG